MPTDRAQNDTVTQLYDDLPTGHRAHLALPPDDEVRARLGRLRLDPALRFAVPPIHVCGADRTIIFEPERAELPHGLFPGKVVVSDYIHHIEVKSLDDLKEWIGVPNRAFAHAAPAHVPDPLRSVNIADLPVVDQIEYSRLSSREQYAVSTLRQGLLFGEVDPALVKRQPYKAVADYMVQGSPALPVFVGNTLYVCDGETVKFSGFAVLSFDSVIVEGAGRLFLGPSTKLHAYQIAHI